MAFHIVDRRSNGKGKSTPNRQKFIRRVKSKVTDAVKNIIREGNIRDIVNSKDKPVVVPVKDLREPTIHHGTGGVNRRVLPGNKEFAPGDRVPRPEQGSGKGGKKGTPDGEGEDEFVFNLTKDEFLDIFFEELALPDLYKKDLFAVQEYVNKRAGFSTDGNPSQLNIMRTMKQSKARRFGLRSGKRRQLHELEAEYGQLQSTVDTMQRNGEDVSIEKVKLEQLEKDITTLKRKIRAIPFIDEVDLRYNRWDKVPQPATQAVMFCLMDVSGSMGEWEKDMAKRFFLLLYLFLTREYERTDIVFIRYHSDAKEVSEEDFFYSKETGGTRVSPALEVMNNIIAERYPTDQWNVYGCQASDGDNWVGDNESAAELLTRSILPKTQYFAYVELDEDRSMNYTSDLWPVYSTIKAGNDNFEMVKITDVTEIYPVFRKLFERRVKGQ